MWTDSTHMPIPNFTETLEQKPEPEIVFLKDNNGVFFPDNDDNEATTLNVDDINRQFAQLLREELTIEHSSGDPSDPALEFFLKNKE